MGASVYLSDRVQIMTLLNEPVLEQESKKRRVLQEDRAQGNR